MPRIGNKYVANVPEAISYLLGKIADLEARMVRLESETTLYLHHIECAQIEFENDSFAVDFYVISAVEDPIKTANAFEDLIKDPKSIISLQSTVDDSDFLAFEGVSFFTHFGTDAIYFYSMSSAAEFEIGDTTIAALEDINDTVTKL